MKKDIILWGLWLVILVGGISSAYETNNDIDKNYKSLQGVNRSLKELEKKVESKTYNFDSINVILQGLRTSK